MRMRSLWIAQRLKPGSQYDAGASVASRASICELSSVGERRRALADAGVRKNYIRASMAQRPSNQIVRKCHVTGRCVFIGTR